MGKLSAEAVANLEECGMQPPLTQMPEYFMSGDDERAKVKAAEVIPRAVHEENIQSGTSDGQQEENFQSGTIDGQQEEDSDWEMFLQVDHGLVSVGNSGEDVGVSKAQAMKVEVNYTYGIEELLKGLTSPLEVTHTVCPREAMAAIESWREAILKELGSVEVAIKRLQVGTEERRRWMSDPRAQRLPTKLVYTVKPNPRAQMGVPSTYYKRKVRLVICGNFATAETQCLYTESAPSEAVRAGLVVTTKNG